MGNGDSSAGHLLLLTSCAWETGHTRLLPGASWSAAAAAIRCNRNLSVVSFSSLQTEHSKLHCCYHASVLAASDGVCKRSELNARPVVTIDGYEDVPQYDEVALKKAVSRQPVSVAIEADQRSFQLYMGGVYDSDDCGEQLDHGVLVGTIS